MFKSLDHLEINKIKIFVIFPYLRLTFQMCGANYLAFAGNKPIDGSRPQASWSDYRAAKLAVPCSTTSSTVQHSRQYHAAQHVLTHKQCNNIILGNWCIIMLNEYNGLPLAGHEESSNRGCVIVRSLQPVRNQYGPRTLDSAWGSVTLYFRPYTRAACGPVYTHAQHADPCTYAHCVRTRVHVLHAYTIHALHVDLCHEGGSLVSDGSPGWLTSEWWVTRVID